MNGTRDIVHDRDPYIDNLKLFLIFLVVVGHTVDHLGFNGAVQGSFAALYKLIYYFHMPMFVLVAGYLSRDNQYFIYNLKSQFLKLMVPYLIFQSLTWFYYKMVVAGFEQPFSLADPIEVLWFLPSLFLWRTVWPLVAGVKYALAIFTAVAVAIGFVPWVDLEYSLSRTFVFFPFFIAGRMMGQRNVALNKLMNRNLSVVIIALGIVAAMLLRKHTSALLFNQIHYSAFDLPIYIPLLNRAAFLLVGMLLGLSVIRFVPSRRFYFTENGKNTLAVYLLHMFVIEALNTGGFFQTSYGLWTVPIYLFVAAGITAALSLNVVFALFRTLDAAVDFATVKGTYYARRLINFR